VGGAGEWLVIKDERRLRERLVRAHDREWHVG
jgi:hypothetical protein